ncbi:MAG TPA: metallopeptidase family protein, partial [Mycobacteriales bacterium]|nr:metallopeptidase family protein [Mycobacteriales bacterium]
ELPSVEVVVEDVPPEGGDGEDAVPLARTAGRDAGAAVLVLYRRPIELRAEDEEDLRDLVAEVVVDAVADLLGLDPDEVDPLP